MEIQEKQNGHRHGNIPCQCPFYLVALFLLLIVPVQAIKNRQGRNCFFRILAQFHGQIFFVKRTCHEQAGHCLFALSSPPKQKRQRIVAIKKATLQSFRIIFVTRKILLCEVTESG